MSHNLRAEAGFTLIELLVAASMMVVITGAAVTMLVSAMGSQAKVTAKADQVGTARVALERLVKELRQGVEVVSGTPGQLALRTFVRAESCGGPPGSSGGAIECEVTYACGAGRCTRRVGGGAATTVVSGLAEVAEPAVFTYEPAPSAGTRFVGVRLALPAPGGGSTVLEGGAALHNHRAPGVG